MPFDRPNPEPKQRAKPDGLLGAWVAAEKFIQIALVLPCAAFIGWLPGAWLDRHFHQTWMAMAGIVLGIVAGLVGVIRMAVVYSADPKLEELDENGNQTEESDARGDRGKAP